MLNFVENFDRLIEELNSNLDKINDKIQTTMEQIRRVDIDINQTLSQEGKEGRLQRLKLYTEIKQQLLNGLKELMSEYREIVKTKGDILKFVTRELKDKPEEVSTKDSGFDYVRELMEIMELIQRRDRSKSEIIREILDEFQKVVSERQTQNNFNDSVNLIEDDSY